MAGRKRAEKAAYWRDWLRRQVESEVSVRQFCAVEGLSEPSFYTWRKRLAVPRESDSHWPVAKAPAGGRRRADVCTGEAAEKWSGNGDHSSAWRSDSVDQGCESDCSATHDRDARREGQAIMV